jgi:hypothetical protein
MQMVDSSRSAGDFQHNKLSLRNEALIHQIVNEVGINGFRQQGTEQLESWSRKIPG